MRGRPSITGPARRLHPLDALFRATLVAGLSLVLVAPVACKTSESTKATSRPGRPAADTLTRGGTPDLSDPARFGAEATEEDWESLVESDLEDLRELRRRARDKAAIAARANGAPDTFPPTNAVADGTRHIDWNAPAGQRATGRRTTEKPGRPPTALPRDTAPPIAVRPLPAATTTAPPSPAQAAPGAAAVGLSDDQLDVLLVNLRRELNLRKAYSDQPLKELLAIAAQSVVDPDLDINPAAFNGLTDQERVLLDKLQSFFARLGRQLDGSIDAEDVIVDAVAELKQVLDRAPELELPTAKLCWRVGGFGDFEAFDRDSFLAHTEQKVILYLEIDRFTSEQNQKSHWVTEISQQLEIYSDADGIPVWSETWQKAVDKTNNRRRDFFTTQIITLPKALSVGRYHLKIRARDEKSGAEAETSLPFEMVADPKLAARVGNSVGA